MTHLMNLDDMHALVDRLEPEARQRAIATLALNDPQAAETLKDWIQQRAGLRELHQDVLNETVPASLVQAAGRFSTMRQQMNTGWRLSGVAASVVLAFGVGWFSHQQLAANANPSAILTQATAQQEFARQASFAYAVYTPEVRHPVEVTAAEQDHLVQWLSKRLGRPLKVPNLSGQGYELVGGRLLPGETGARAQFMFQNAQGQRITLYLGTVDQKSDQVDQGETGFRYESEGPISSFYWFDQGFGCALSGQINRERLIALATLVYQQL